MKKKLLSLVLAGAMVASTSVSAFAAATPNTMHEDTTIQDVTDSKEVPVEITGNVLDNKGNAKPGTINVSVPTATSFSVNATTGELTSADMFISNNSYEKIKVTASRFEDADGANNINIVKRETFEAAETGDNHNERGTIWLRLGGGRNILDFTSEQNDDMYGKMYGSDGLEKDDDDDYVINEVNAQSKLRLRLEGKGGTKAAANKPADKAIQDNFKLILKISRAQ